MIQNPASNQLLRYLLVGGFNTLFGYALYCGSFYLLSKHLQEAHIIAAAISNVVAIAVAFMGYKFIVFNSRGRFMRQLARCYLVYGCMFAVSLGLLFIAVNLCHINAYVAQALVTAITVAGSFFGHKFYSFYE